jgi:hypothetical protein
LIERTRSVQVWKGRGHRWSAFPSVGNRGGAPERARHISTPSSAGG